MDRIIQDLTETRYTGIAQCFGNSGFMVWHPTGMTKYGLWSLPPMRLKSLCMFLIQRVLPGALVVVLIFPVNIFAEPAEQDHVVSPEALQESLQDSSATRQREITNLTQLVSSPAAERAIRDAHMNPEEVQRAIPTLSDEELANLSARAASVQQKIAGGNLTTDEILIVVLIAAIVIIVIALR